MNQSLFVFKTALSFLLYSGNSIDITILRHFFGGTTNFWPKQKIQAARISYSIIRLFKVKWKSCRLVDVGNSFEIDIWIRGYVVIEWCSDHICRKSRLLSLQTYNPTTEHWHIKFMDLWINEPLVIDTKYLLKYFLTPYKMKIMTCFVDMDKLAPGTAAQSPSTLRIRGYEDIVLLFCDNAKINHSIYLIWFIFYK